MNLDGKIIEGRCTYYGVRAYCKNTCKAMNGNTYIQGAVYIWCGNAGSIYYKNLHKGYMSKEFFKKNFEVYDEKDLKAVDDLFNKSMDKICQI